MGAENESVNGALQSLDFVLDPEFLFFEGSHPNFVPIGVGHFGFYHFLKFSVFFGQFLHVSFKGHRAHLVHETVAIRT